MSSDPKKYCEIWKLAKSFPSPAGPYEVVKDFDLFMREGEFVSLIGHSGCGKSTVLSILAGLTEKTYGSIILADKEVRGAGPDRGVVFQAPCLLPWMSAIDNVLLGVDQVFPAAPRAERRQVAEHYLELVGLGDAMNKMPAELSQGMRQRVGIARAFGLSPKLVLLD
jgi:nitrate/nitrite transport system ATP-binding protein